LKSLSRKLTRYLVANPFIRSRDQMPCSCVAMRFRLNQRRRRYSRPATGPSALAAD
jgi:hypothetical protein